MTCFQYKFSHILKCVFCVILIIAKSILLCVGLHGVYNIGAYVFRIGISNIENRSGIYAILTNVILNIGYC